MATVGRLVGGIELLPGALSRRRGTVIRVLKGISAWNMQSALNADPYTS